MNQNDLTLVDEESEFIPHYTTDGRFLYHELSPYTSIRVAPHTSAMKIGKKYYSMMENILMGLLSRIVFFLRI